MGYTIRIGNAEPVLNKDGFPFIECGVEIKPESSSDYPDIPIDFTGNQNERNPSYVGWSHFCRSVGLSDLFFGTGGLFSNHPGCAGITEKDAIIISEALSKNKKTEHCINLERLIWLDFWVRWALDNCDTPAIQNY